MFIEIEQKNKYVLIKLEGRLDAFNFEIVETKLKTLYKSGKRFIALDLHKIDFINLHATLTIEHLAQDFLDQKGQIFIIGKNQRTDLLKKTFQNQVIFFQNESELSEHLKFIEVENASK